MINLLASAPSLDTIGECIAKFYCGKSKTLVPQDKSVWLLTRANGTTIPGVRVIQKGRRYRFEMTDT